VIDKLKDGVAIHQLFHDYMSYMSRFFEIEDYDQWSARAVAYLNLYGHEPNRHIYSLESTGEKIGFALVNDQRRFNGTGMAIAEFYICDSYRGLGHGRELAAYVFNQFPGHWEVAVARKNRAAVEFWQKVISRFTADRYDVLKIDSYDGIGYSFCSAPG
jgi:predicted acetyltransferase